MINLDTSAIRQTRWYEYALRLLFGGFITVVAGVIAKKFGPAVGGLFLAFPAIFPATATLAEKHEREKKEEKGLGGDQRARDAAALEAVGCALGSVGLLLFGALVWTLLPHQQPWIVLIGATCLWGIASTAMWFLRRKF